MFPQRALSGNVCQPFSCFLLTETTEVSKCVTLKVHVQMLGVRVDREAQQKERKENGRKWKTSQHKYERSTGLRTRCVYHYILLIKKVNGRPMC